ncbi:MAG: IS5 family transposase [Nitrososphaeraceae archaeon]|nr:IS5 family transposase [Nitrososphaeraceae archaeon]
MTGVNSLYEIPDVLWDKIVALLPPPTKKKKKAGRPRMNDRKAMSAIFYVLRTGCQWNALPRSLGASSTVHDRFQEWRKAGVFKRMWIDGLSVYDKKIGIDWKWQAMDGIITKAPLGGKRTGPNPTDRAKSGTKRSMLVDGKGVPLGITVDAANKHDMKMTKATLQSIVIHRPEEAASSIKQHMCMDRGYDFPEVYELLEDYGYTIHIRLRITRGRRSKNQRKRIPTYRSRHWVVERTHSWMNRFRRLLIRWEKKVENYIGMLHFACAWITYRNAGLFG